MQRIITEEQLAELREAISKVLSPKRYDHTLEVEKMTEKLCKIYCPDKILMLRAAALLHDITKEDRKSVV